MNRLKSSLSAIALCISHSFTAYALNPAAAQEYFKQGRAAFESGDFARAAELFAASQREEPSAGTMWNLAECHARLGRTATAHREYLAAAELAHQQGRLATRKEESEVRFAQEVKAQQAARELEARLSYLTLKVAESPQGLEVTINSSLIESSQLGKPLALDPGVYKVAAAAPGYKSWSGEFHIKPEVAPGEVRDQVVWVALSRVEAESNAERAIPSKSNPDKPLKHSHSSQRTIAYWVGGGGIVALGVGGVLGALSINEQSRVKELCNNNLNECQNKKAADEAVKSRDQYTVGFAVAAAAGVVALGAATYLYLSSPSETRKSVALSASIDGRQGVLLLHGKF